MSLLLEIPGRFILIDVMFPIWEEYSSKPYGKDPSASLWTFIKKATFTQKPDIWFTPAVLFFWKSSIRLMLQL